MPLDKNTYLKVQCFINLTETTFPQIKHSVFLHGDNLIWSGLEQDDMRALYRLLTGGFLSTTFAASSGDVRIKVWWRGRKKEYFILFYFIFYFNYIYLILFSFYKITKRM